MVDHFHVVNDVRAENKLINRVEAAQAYRPAGFFASAM